MVNGASDASIVPFDRHPAVLGEITGVAARMERLAGRSVDLRAGTDQQFNPAQANWDGLAAAELAEAPVGVRRDAVRSGDAMVWLAGTLRYWHSQVAQFNSRVDRLQDERAQAESTRWGVAEGEDFTLARMEQERALRDRWWEAHLQFIDDGSRTAATMLRTGPTAENLRLLTAAGVWGSPAGAVALFLPRWEDQAMQDLASELGDIVERINNPYYHPTDEELARLEEMLALYADDEAFSYYFLTELGPEGLLAFTGNLATLQLDRPGVDRDDADLAATVGSIQASLGIALATATTRRGTGDDYPFANTYQPGQYELDTQWVVDLMVAGQQQMAIGDPQSPMLYNEVYGYHMLGVLLHSGDYDPHFLSVAGGSMIDFEMAQGNSEFWRESAAGESFRLNWITTDGSDDLASAGYDPMVGLMSALDRNPEGALSVLTGLQTSGDGPSYASDAPSGVRLPRLDYLLTDREWPMDIVAGRDYYEISEDARDSYVNPGLAQFGSVLEGATGLADDRAVLLVESIVYELNADEQAMGYPNGTEVGDGQSRASIEHDLMHPVLRESVANIMADYIPDVNRAMDGGNSTMPGGRGADFSDKHMLRLLSDLGKDEQAHQTVREAQAVYSAASYDYYLSGAAGLQPDDLDQRIHAAEQAAGRHGAVMGALDYGGITQQWHAQLEADNQHNRDVKSDFMVAGFVVDQVASRTIGTVPLAGGPASDFISGVLAEAEQSAMVDNSGLVAYTVAETLGDGRQSSSDLATASLYHSGQLQGLPPELVTPDGTPKPMADWTATDYEAWQHYRDTTGHATVVRLGNDAASAYDQGIQGANVSLNNTLQN